MKSKGHLIPSSVFVSFLALLLSACGSSATNTASSSSATTKATTTSAPTTTSNATTTTGAQSPTTSSTTTSSVAVQQGSTTITRCHASQLSFTYAVESAVAMNRQGEFFRYTNDSNTSCTLYGYPGIEFFASNGQPINTPIHRGGSFIYGFDPGAQLVTLSPGSSVYFSVGWVTYDVPLNTDAGCITPASVDSYPPNSYTPLDISLQPGGNYSTPGNSRICAQLGLNVTAVAPSSVFLSNTNLPSSLFTATNFVS